MDQRFSAAMLFNFHWSHDQQSRRNICLGLYCFFNGHGTGGKKYEEEPKMLSGSLYMSTSSRVVFAASILTVVFEWSDRLYVLFWIELDRIEELEKPY